MVYTLKKILSGAHHGSQPVSKYQQEATELSSNWDLPSNHQQKGIESYPSKWEGEKPNTIQVYMYQNMHMVSFGTQAV